MTEEGLTISVSISRRCLVLDIGKKVQKTYVLKGKLYHDIGEHLPAPNRGETYDCAVSCAIIWSGINEMIFYANILARKIPTPSNGLDHFKLAK